MQLDISAWWRQHQSARMITMTQHASAVGGGGVGRDEYVIDL